MNILFTKNLQTVLFFLFFNNNTRFILLTKAVKMTVKHINSKILSRFAALFLDK